MLTYMLCDPRSLASGAAGAAIVYPNQGLGGVVTFARTAAQPGIPLDGAALFG